MHWQLFCFAILTLVPSTVLWMEMVDHCLRPSFPKWSTVWCPGLVVADFSSSSTHLRRSETQATGVVCFAVRLSLCFVSFTESIKSTFNAPQESLKTDVKQYYLLFLSFPFQFLMSCLNHAFCVLCLSRLHKVDSERKFPPLHWNIPWMFHVPSGSYQSCTFLRAINYLYFDHGILHSGPFAMAISTISWTQILVNGTLRVHFERRSAVREHADITLPPPPPPIVEGEWMATMA